MSIRVSGNTMTSYRDDRWIARMTYQAEELRGEKGEEIRHFSGVASTGRLDRAGTFVDQVSLEKAARAFHKRRGKVFWNHGWSIPIGRHERIGMEGSKLHMSGIIGRGFSVPVAVGPLGMPVLMSVDELWEIMKQDLTTSLSIAFKAEEQAGERDAEGKVAPSTLLVTDLLEVSVVTIPSNPDCEFSLTRALDDQTFRAAHLDPRVVSREELWGIRLDGSAAAAAVGEEADADLDGNALDLLDESRSGDIWERVREEILQCRDSMKRNRS